MSHFDFVTGQRRERLLMETAMRIQEIYDDMYYAHHINPDKADAVDSIERLGIFVDWAREFENKYYGTEEYEDFIGLTDEFAVAKVNEIWG